MLASWVVTLLPELLEPSLSRGSLARLPAYQPDKHSRSAHESDCSYVHFTPLKLVHFHCYMLSPCRVERSRGEHLHDRPVWRRLLLRIPHCRQRHCHIQGDLLAMKCIRLLNMKLCDSAYQALSCSSGAACALDACCVHPETRHVVDAHV